jgi:hypothetical protein
VTSHHSATYQNLSVYASHFSQACYEPSHSRNPTLCIGKFVPGPLIVSGQLHAPAALPPGKETRYPLHRRLGGSQSRCGHIWWRKIRPYWESNPPRSSSLISVLTELSRFIILFRTKSHKHEISYSYSCAKKLLSDDSMSRQEYYKKSTNVLCKFLHFPPTTGQLLQVYQLKCLSCEKGLHRSNW